MLSITDFINKKIAVTDIEQEEDIMQIVQSVHNNFDTDCKYFYAGGFDSPGYDIDCYVIAYLEEGIIKGVAVQVESC